MASRRNEVIINGVRHIFKGEAGGFYPCPACSIRYLCETIPFCQKIFGKKGLFEIYEKK